MTRFAIIGILMATACTGVIAAQEKAIKDLDGTYKVTVLEKAGKPAPADLTESVRIVLKGDSLTIKIGEIEKKAKIKVDTSKTPNTFDLTPSEGPESGKVFPGILKIEKGEVMMAYTEKGDRPKEFKSEGETILIKMKKEEKKK